MWSHFGLTTCPLLWGFHSENKNGDPKAAAADLCNGTSFTNPHLIVDRGSVLHLATSKANPECSIILQTDEALALAR